MSGPWEAYAPQAASSSGPWEAYASKKAPNPKPESGGGFAQGAGNLLAGALRGAGSIGATLLAPMDMIGDALDGRGVSLESNRQRRADMDAALGGLGAETDSWMYMGGKIAGEIAGTAGAGGALANVAGRGLAAAAPQLLPRAQPLLSAIQSGGMVSNGAGLGTRVAGGAISGGASAAMVDPNDALTGAIIGGAAPAAFKAVNKVGQGIGAVWRAATTPEKVKIAERIAQQSGASMDDVMSALNKQGPELIPGYKPTVPQILQTPELSQLQRTLKTAGANALGDAERAQQAAYRQALESVAPADVTVNDAAARAGDAIKRYAVPAREAAGQRVNQAFEAVDPFNESALLLPLEEMQRATNKYLGPGTFGTGARATQAVDTARRVGMEELPGAEMIPKALPFQTVQNLRSSIGEAAEQASAKGANKEAAALRQMVAEIDGRVNRAAGQGAQAGEHFPRDMGDQYRAALKLHADKMNQFETGPQVGMFRKGADGQAAIQGAEIPGKFFSGRASQVEDMQAFKRLAGDVPNLMQEMKRFAVTEGLNTGDVSGNLGAKFMTWAKSRAGASGELFSPNEMATIREVGKAVDRSLKAESLGRVTGSDTAQKLASMQSLGLLDSRVVDVLANRIPLVGNFTGPMLSGLRNAATQNRNTIMSGLLANPDEMAAALRSLPQSRQGGLLDLAMERALPLTYRAAPVGLLGLNGQ